MREGTKMLVKGKNVVITGCLKGIGRSTLDIFAENGANIWACCEKKTTEFEEHILGLSSEYNIWVRPVYFDFLDESTVKVAVKQIHQDKDSIDALINIAGITKDALFHMVSMKDMKTIFEVNLFAQITFSQYITKMMLKNKRGSVIYISSISALDGNVGQLSYSASKAALVGVTKTLSAELSPRGIRVNAIAPGVIDTEMTSGVSGTSLQELINSSALKKIGRPSDVAKAILFLASDHSSYITGQVLRVDGGIR